MQTALGHLTFCTNIFPGEDWDTHLGQLRQVVPFLRRELGPEKPLGLGLRLSNKASLQLSKEPALAAFREWLQEENAYVFTMNGFPYGQFHHTRVKDQVHAPDWTSDERLQYTLRLFRLLAALLPEGMDGGVSTSPLTYKFWWPDTAGAMEAREKATWHLLQVLEHLHRLQRRTGQCLHIDLEPEPDGMIGTGEEFLAWYGEELLPAGITLLSDRCGLSAAEAEEAVRHHLRLCYDVCHFAVNYEDASAMLDRLEAEGVRIGKWQLSSALSANLGRADSRADVLEALRPFDEPVYLHQVVARHRGGALSRYPDLGDALSDPRAQEAEEWRAHFHVPLFAGEYGLLGSTRAEVSRVLQWQAERRLCPHLEVETYTWDILPPHMKAPLEESVLRELQWVLAQMEKTTS